MGNSHGENRISTSDEVPDHVGMRRWAAQKDEADSEKDNGGNTMDGDLQRERQDTSLVFAKMEEDPAVLSNKTGTGDGKNDGYL